MKPSVIQFGIGPSGMLSVLTGTVTTISWSSLLRTLSCSRGDSDEFLGYIVDACEEVFPTLQGQDSCHGTIVDMASAESCFELGQPSVVCEAIWARLLQIRKDTGADYLWLLNENF